MVRLRLPNGHFGKLTPKSSSTSLSRVCASNTLEKTCSTIVQSRARSQTQPGSIARYCFKLSPRRLINGHCVFFRNKRDQILMTAKPRVAGSKFGRISSSSVSMESYASCTMRRVHWRIRFSFSIEDSRYYSHRYEGG